MFPRHSKKLLFGAAFLLLMLHLAHAGPKHSSKMFPDEAHATRTTVTVHVVWLPSFRATDAFCALSMPPKKDKSLTIVGCYSPHNQTIYAVQPDSFNDNVHLEILGHEFWHALGAEHPAK